MNKQTNDLDDLISDATDYIKFQLNYSRSTVDKYTKSWKQLKRFMESNGIKSYNQDVEKQILFL